MATGAGIGGDVKSRVRRMAGVGGGADGGGNLLITFVTGNKKKLEEVVAILKDGSSDEGFTVTSQSIDLPELQGEPEEIAVEKCRLAFERIQRPVRYGVTRKMIIQVHMLVTHISYRFSVRVQQPTQIGDGGRYVAVFQRAGGPSWSVLQAFPKNKRAQQGLANLNKPRQPTATQSPPQETINQLINLYNQGQLVAVVEQAQALTRQYPNEPIIWNILGGAAAETGQKDQAINAFKRVIAIKPDYAEAHYNMGNFLRDQGKLEEAIEAYTKALSLKPDYAEAYNNMGNALKDQGKLEEAIEAYTKALSLKPDYAKPY